MSLSSFKSKYDDFLAPYFKITVDGGEVPRDTCSDLVVDQASGATSGGCQFVVPDFYNRQSRKLLPDAGKFQPGKQVKVSVGYGSKLKGVFTGFISQLSFQFNENQSLVVNCLDARALMKRSRPLVINKGKSTEDIVKTILKKYSPLIASNEVSLPALASGNLADDQDDLEYIITECEKRGMVFFIRDTKAFITKRKGDVCVTLDWEEYHITHRLNYLNTAFNGIGMDFSTMEGYTSREESKQRGSQSDMAAQEYFMRLEPSLSESAGKSVISAAVRNAASQAQTATVVCAGLPEFEIGKMVELNNSPLKPVCGTTKFFISAVKHKIDKEFTTEVELCLGD